MTDENGPGPGARPVSFGSEPTYKKYLHGTHRLISPRDTLERAELVKERAGVTRVANVTGLDHIGIPVVAVVRPNARSLAVSQGKGMDLDAARASGLMEAIESHHAEHVDLPLRLGTYNELRQGRRVVDVDRLPRLSVSTFSPDRRLLWCEGWQLTSEEPCWVPYEMVHTDYTLPLPSGSGNFMMTSNGLASGNHLLEAVSHGICEVIERDAVALWSMGGGNVRHDLRLDLATVDDPGCRKVLYRLEAAGMLVGVWDITSDLGLATFACVIADREISFMGYGYTSHGSGCHPAREVALMRSLTEAVQTRLTYIAGARDDADRDFFERARNPDRVLRVRDELLEGQGGPMRHFTRVPSRVRETFDEDIAWELERLAAVGIDEVVVVDLSKPGFHIPVVRVIIPGLESLHDAPGYVPGPRARRMLAHRAEAS